MQLRNRSAGIPDFSSSQSRMSPSSLTGVAGGAGSGVSVTGTALAFVFVSVTDGETIGLGASDDGRPPFVSFVSSTLVSSRLVYSVFSEERFFPVFLRILVAWELQDDYTMTPRQLHDHYAMTPRQLRDGSIFVATL